MHCRPATHIKARNAHPSRPSPPRAQTNEPPSGAASPMDFHFFAGASIWAPGQLEAEMAKGYWLAVEASKTKEKGIHARMHL